MFLDKKNLFVPKTGITYEFSHESDWGDRRSIPQDYSVEPETEKSPHLEDAKMAYLNALKKYIRRCLKDYECQVEKDFITVYSRASLSSIPGGRW